MKNCAANEKGFILVTAMVVLLLLVLIGIGSMRTSSIEMLISGNDKFHKEAFYAADSGVNMSPRLISMARDAGTDPVAGAQITLFGVDGATASDGTRFYQEAMGFIEDAVALTGDFQLQVGTSPVTVDIDHTGASHGPGESTEFGMGAAGIGGGGGGARIGYTLTATGTAPKETVSVVSARYRYVPGTAGGLK